MEEALQAERKQNLTLLDRYARLAALQPTTTGPFSPHEQDGRRTRPRHYSATTLANKVPAASDMGSIHPTPQQTMTAECDGTSADHENR